MNTPELFRVNNHCFVLLCYIYRATLNTRVLQFKRVFQTLLFLKETIFLQKRLLSLSMNASVGVTTILHVYIYFSFWLLQHFEMRPFYRWLVVKMTLPCSSADQGIPFEGCQNHHDERVHAIIGLQSCSRKYEPYIIAYWRVSMYYLCFVFNTL